MLLESIKFSRDDLIKCYNFSKSIISSSNQYNRFLQSQSMQIERTFAGKLGEYAFLLLLDKKGISYPEGDMFEIFNGQSNVDSFDFKTPVGKLIDIKVASKPFHKRIMVPIDQFSLIKDYYVGIKLDFEVDSQSKLIINSVKNALIYGYCLRQKLENIQTRDFGEGLCKHILLKDLQSIDVILEQF